MAWLNLNENGLIPKERDQREWKGKQRAAQNSASLEAPISAGCTVGRGGATATLVPWANAPEVGMSVPGEYENAEVSGGGSS